MRRLGGRFALEREIGAGGMSVVFLGRDEVLDRPVAVKVLKGGFEESSGFSARFRREGRTAARLTHPNIVQVYDAGEDELEGRETSYIVMEYVPGGDLGKLVKEKGPLTEKGLARTGADVASGLAHAHEEGVVHRDIKPQNILIDSYGNSKLADFGIARALDATQATATGSYLGTAAYSSPEQLRGAEITPKTDVYSLGCTLYEAAVGEPPFSGGPIEVASQQLTKPPIPPRQRRATLGEPFEALILSCLAKDPDERPGADELRERLLRISAAASGVTTTTPGVGETVRGVGAAGVAGVTGAARAGERGFETVVRGVRNRVGSAGASEATMQTSHQTFQPGFGRRISLAAGIAALLLLALLGAGVYALLGSGTGETGQVAEQQQEVAQPPAVTPDETTTSSEPVPPANEAAQAVFNMYVEESYRDAEGSYAYLSERMQEEVGSPEQWAEQERLGTLWYVYFTRYPQAEVSGEEARVGFTVRQNRTGGARLVSGTWVCVVEDGEWKLDRLEGESSGTL
jgi:eukaryotic-like serine/threonine-protein kinase